MRQDINIIDTLTNALDHIIMRNLANSVMQTIFKNIAAATIIFIKLTTTTTTMSI
jgi:hypothetical protein